VKTTENTRSRAEIGIEAAHAARARIIEVYADEYAEFYAEERTKRGLSEVPPNNQVAALKERVAQLEAQLFPNQPPKG
jgi:pyridoxine 5'-phosphate synthase PdxJ